MKYNNEQRDELMQTGIALLRNGYSVIPINRETKKPFWRLLPSLYDEQGQPVMKQSVDKETGEISEFHARGWKPYQTERATEDAVVQWVNTGAQLALVGGAISRGLLIIDFDMYDGKTKNMHERWKDACTAAGYPVGILPTQRTGSGGWQVAVRCDNPGENMKLAWVPDATELRGRKVAIETRGEGGYAVIAPSLHPSGNLYRMVVGQFYDTPKVTQAGAEAILDIARSLNEVEQVVPAYVASERQGPYQGVSVIEAYNASRDIRAELRVRGYTDAYGGRMHRPGADRTSQASVEFKDNESWHWSSNDDFSDGHFHSPFDVRCHHEFGGDVKRAVATIAKELGIDRRAEHPEPSMTNGTAYCPYHKHRRLERGKKSGWYCPALSQETRTGFCDYRWEGEGYTPSPGARERLMGLRSFATVAR